LSVNGNKALLILTDGFDSGSTHSWRQAADAANRADASVYAIQYRSAFGRNFAPDLYRLVIPISGVKLYTECESSIDLTGFSLRLFRMTLTSLLVRLKSEHVDRLEMCKSPLTTRVRRYLTVSCFSATLRECCNCAAF